VEPAFIPASDSVIGGGSITSPGANTTIAQASLPTAGKSKILIHYCLSGTAETNLANVSVVVNGSAIVTSLPTITGSGWHEIELYVYTTGTVYVRSQSAATSGAVYSASVSVTRLS
jgi:hypothetical protein